MGQAKWKGRSQRQLSIGLDALAQTHCCGGSGGFQAQLAALQRERDTLAAEKEELLRVRDECRDLRDYQQALARDIQRYQGELIVTRKELGRCGAALAAEKKRSDGEAQDAAAKQALLDVERRSNSAVHGALGEARAQLQGMEETLRVREAEVKMLTSQLAAAEGQHQAEKRLQNFMQGKAQVKAEKLPTEEVAARLRTELENMEEKLRVREVEVTMLKSQLALEAQKMGSIAAEVLEVTTQLQQAKKEGQLLSSEVASLKNEVESLRDALGKERCGISVRVGEEKISGTSRALEEDRNKLARARRVESMASDLPRPSRRMEEPEAAIISATPVPHGVCRVASENKVRGRPGGGIKGCSQGVSRGRGDQRECHLGRADRAQGSV